MACVYTSSMRMRLRLGDMRLAHIGPRTQMGEFTYG